MRVTLSQDELFEAISEHLRGKLNLADSASIEISFTAGRSPKGYTADVDITYPKSDIASRITAKDPEDEPAAATAVQPETEAGVRSASEAATTTIANPAAAGVASADDLFNT